MSDGNFSERLKNLKQKLSGGESKGNIAEASGIKVVADMVAGLAVGLVLGYFTDRWLGTKPIFLIIFMIFGFFIGLYIFYKDLTRKRNSGNKS